MIFNVFVNSKTIFLAFCLFVLGGEGVVWFYVCVYLCFGLVVFSLSNLLSFPWQLRIPSVVWSHQGTFS